MASLDALSDAALAKLAWRVDIGDSGSAWHEGALQAYVPIARALRDHIIAVLADQAGDPEALAAVLRDAERRYWESDPPYRFRQSADGRKEWADGMVVAAA